YGQGARFFAGLNVLPKAAWFTSYSDRIIPDINMSFLKALHKVSSDNDILGDTANLDFTTTPYRTIHLTWITIGRANEQKLLPACWRYWHKTTIAG
ncbi:MAG: hypothetical protein ACOYOA_16825, partial [Saprospiraceae bacterium]